MLEPNKRKPREKFFTTYDFEWYPGTYEIRLASAYDGIEHRTYYKVDDFLNGELRPKNTDRIFFAHSGGMADIQFVLERILTRNNPAVHVEAAFRGAAAILVWVTHKNHRWLFADSFRLLPDSLAKIGESIGMAKGGQDYFCPDFPACGHAKDGKSTCIFYAPLSVLRDYNQRDNEVLYTAISRLQDEVLSLGGELKPTLPAMALHLFRSRFLKTSIRTSEAVNERAKVAYIGARTEDAATHCGPAQYYDFNSSFPFSMTKPQPGEYMGAQDGGTAYDKPGFLGLVDAEIRVPDSNVPPLPRRYGQRIFFPTGAWRSWFDVEDMRLLEECGGRIEKIHETMSFAPFHDMADYANTVYDLRNAAKRDNNDFRSLLLKLFLNSLYGKLGEANEGESILIRPKTLPACTMGCEGPCECRLMLMPGVFLQKEYREVEHAHVPIPAHITALSRAMLCRALRKLPEYIYCDTDGFPSTIEFPSSDALGALKLEKSISGGEFLAPKMYRLEHAADCKCGGQKCKKPIEVRAKGFPRITDAQFQLLKQGEKVLIERMMRTKELFRQGKTYPQDATHVDADGALQQGIWKRRHFKGCDCASCQLSEPLKKRKFEGRLSRPWTVEELGERLGE